MKSLTIPYDSDKFKADYSFIDLFNRVIKGKRANWTDIHNGPGVYIIYLENATQPSFTERLNNPNLKKFASCEWLLEKWQRTNSTNETDIVYIGKGECLKDRIRALIRFGHGKMNKHFGGEWLWQIKNLEDLKLLTSSCPLYKEGGYERWLIDIFLTDHNELPLCNRKKGDDVPIWKPEN